MQNFLKNSRVRFISLTGALLLVLSNPLLINSAKAANTTEATTTVGFSLVADPVDPCTPMDYSLTLSDPGPGSFPVKGTMWNSGDIGITQITGNSCPSNVAITPSTLNIVATSFSNGLGTPTNISCDDAATPMSINSDSTSASCSSSTLKVNISVFVPETAVPGTLYQSTVTVTAVL